MCAANQGNRTGWASWEQEVYGRLAAVLPAVDGPRGRSPGERVATADGDAWPLIVDLPLYWLGCALGCDRPGDVYLRLRDACEGVVRLMWAVSILDAIELSANAAALAGSSPEAEARRDAVERVLASTTRSGFSPGEALELLTRPTDGAQPVLERLATAAHQCLADPWTPALQRAWSASRQARRGAIQFVDWRNKEVGHGVADMEDAFVRRLTHGHQGVAPAIDIAAGMLGGLGGWLGALQARLARLGWPSLAEWAAGTGRHAKASGRRAITGAPSPVAWLGRPEQSPECGPYWVLDGARRGEVVLLDPLHNVRVAAPRAELPRKVLDLVRRASWRLDPLELSSAGVKAAQEHLERTFEARQVRTAATDKLADVVEQKPGWHLVTGPAGVGKTFLLRQLIGELHGKAFVLKAFTVPGGSASLRAMLVEMTSPNSLDTAGLEAVRDHEGAPQRMPDPAGEVEAAHAWWRKLADQARRRGRPLVVVLDGLEETTARDGWTLALLPPPVDAKAWGMRVVLGYRSEAELPASVQEALGAALGSVEGEAVGDAVHRFDVGASMRADRVGFRRFLTKRHAAVARHMDTRLSSGRTLFEELVERAEWRFSWVFHYARGLEVGFLRTPSEAEGSSGLEAWPRREAYYREYLAWLEKQAGGHPEYVSVLRRVLLTYARVRMPINDRTLLWLLSDAEGQEAWGQGELWSMWVRPVLDDLADFLYRRRVGPHCDDVLERDAYAAVAYDAEGLLEPAPRAGAPCTAALLAPAQAGEEARAVPRPLEAMVRSLAHEELAAYLRSDALPDAWRRVRDEVGAHLRHRARAALDHLETHPTCGRAWVRTCTQRIADLGAWSVSDEGTSGVITGGGTLGDFRRLSRIYNGPAAYQLRAQPRPHHWVAVWRNAVDALRAASSLDAGASPDAVARALEERPEVVHLLGVALGNLGRALLKAQRAVEAVEVHEQEVRTESVRAGLAPKSPEEAIGRRWEEDPDAVRSYLMALGNLGRALRWAGRAVEAVEVHEQEVRIVSVRAGLGPESSEEAIGRRWEEDPAAVLGYAAALDNLGLALREAGRVVAAVEVHELAVRIEAVRAGLGPQSSEDTIGRRWEEDPAAVREFSIALGNLGRALGEAGRAVEALEVHELAVRIEAVRAGLGPESSEAAIGRRWEEDPAAVRSYSAALDGLGRALIEAGRADAAVAAHEKERRIDRVRAALGPTSTEQDIAHRWDEAPDAVRNYLDALGGLRHALLAAGRADEAATIHEEQARIEQVRARLESEGLRHWRRGTKR